MLDFHLTQPAPRGLNKKLPKSKLKKQRSDEDRSAPGPRREGWDLEAWGCRRALKIGTTQNEQDVSRCYQNIPTGMYHQNLEAARIRRTCPGLMEVQLLCPDKLESQCAVKCLTKREARGAQAVRRKRAPVSRTYRRRESIEELQENTSGRDRHCDCQSSHHSGATIETALEEFSASLECLGNIT